MHIFVLAALAISICLAGGPAFAARPRAQNIPGPPPLSYPPNNSNITGSSIQYVWGNVLWATTYYLDIWTSQGSFWSGYVGYTYYFTISGHWQNDTQYYWRVFACNPDNQCSVSTTWSFISRPSFIPLAPILTHPTNGGNVGTTQIEFDWNWTPGEANYDFQIDFDNGFTAPFFVDAPNIGLYTGEIVTNFPDNGDTFYWRLRAKNSLGTGPWSTWRVVNGPSMAPDVPIQVSPAQGATVNGQTLLFQWNPTARAAQYLLEIATNSGFTTGYYSLLLDDYYTGAYVDGFPDNGLLFYWRVTAQNVLGNRLSTIRNFYNGALVLAPTLVSPANGSNLRGSTIHFDWNDTAHATDDFIQVARDSGFTSIFTQGWLGDPLSYADVPGFANDNAKYYWHVKAHNLRGDGPYSLTWSFFNGPCAPKVGSGSGFLLPYSHIDTCYDSSTSLYALQDISRRINNPADHSHSGRMGPTSYIETTLYPAAPGQPMTDNDNIWNLATQRSGVDAHVNTAATYDYLNLFVGLNAFDNLGTTMTTRVEVPTTDPALPNAFWFGPDQRVSFTTPVGSISPFSPALDVVGHEWGHAVTERASWRPALTDPWHPGTVTAGLFYAYESGALNEAFSDWMGTAVEQYYGETNWTMGEGVIVLRDLSNPRSPALSSVQLADGLFYDLRQPDTYNGVGYLSPTNCTPPLQDNCGVHKNSGVPNKMFYLLSAGGTHNTVQVTGIGLPAAMAIAYKANLQYWPNNATFQDALAGMVTAAAQLYPSNPDVVNQVKNAWGAVGVGTLPAITVTASPAAGGTVSGGGSYAWGASVTVTATANTGYRLSNWTEGGAEVSTSDSYTFTVNGDRSLTANFLRTQPDISVTPTSLDFSNLIIGKTSAAQTVTVSNSSDEPLLVGGVFVTGGDSSQFVKSADGCSGAALPLNQSCQIQVKFAPTSVGPKQSTLYIPSNDPDSPFINVALSGTGDPLPTYTITASAGIGGSITPSGTITVAEHATQDFTIAAETGFRILDVVVDGTSKGAVASYSFPDVTASHTISATFALLIYTITPSAGPGGTISPSAPVQVIYGGNQTFTIAAVSGATVKDVLVDGASVGAVTTYTFTYVTGDHSIQASFGSSILVTRNGTGVGSVASDPAGITCPADCIEKYPYGTVVTLTATPNAGSSFTGWTGTSCSGIAPCTVTMTIGRIVNAVFADTIPPVTTATPPGGTYAAPQSVILTCSDAGRGCGSTYYTIDGTTPSTSSPVYSAPIPIATPTTLKYFSRDLALNSEPVSTQVYDFYPPASAVTLTGDPTSPIAYGTTINFTAGASGGSGSYEYQYLVKKSIDTIWITVRSYSADNTWRWITDSSDYSATTYNIMVQARNAGSIADFETSLTIDYTLTTSGSTGPGRHRR